MNHHTHALVQHGLTSHQTTLAPDQIARLRELLPRSTPMGSDTRHWENTPITPELTHMLRHVLRPYLHSLQQLITHDQVCESIVMTTTPGELGQPLHVDNHAPTWLASWYTVATCLTPVDTDVGTFDYVPGTHQQYEHLTIEQVQQLAFTQHLIDQQQPVTQLSLPAGGTFCYNTALLHRGTPNRHQDRSRDVYFVTFGPSHTQWCDMMRAEAPGLVTQMSNSRNSLATKCSEQLSQHTLKQFQ